MVFKKIEFHGIYSVVFGFVSEWKRSLVCLKKWTSSAIGFVSRKDMQHMHSCNTVSCAAMLKIFLELKLLHHTHNLHSSISLFQQGQSPSEEILKKKRRRRKEKQVSHIHWVSSASGCYDQRAIVLGGLFSKLLSLGTSITRRKLIRNKAGGMMLRWASTGISS